jgi:hypothetical protein
VITEKDLQEAIAECQGQRNPSASTCIKLAAFYTIKRELFGEGKNVEQLPSGYSFLPAPEAQTADPMIRNPGESEFARAIDGRKQEEVWPLLDEMMDTIYAIHPRLYHAVMNRLR